MSKRGDRELVEDIRLAIDKIQSYAGHLTLAALVEDTLVQDAVIRNLQIIGEAAKKLSPEYRKRHRAIAWSEMARMRDRLVHDYAGVNWEIVWDVIRDKLPTLNNQLAELAALRGKP
jgi:uncharacterized protein with HEPN domain